jgi:hypothetical protein
VTKITTSVARTVLNLLIIVSSLHALRRIGRRDGCRENAPRARAECPIAAPDGIFLVTQIAGHPHSCEAMEHAVPVAPPHASGMAIDFDGLRAGERVPGAAARRRGAGGRRRGARALHDQAVALALAVAVAVAGGRLARVGDQPGHDRAAGVPARDRAELPGADRDHSRVRR